MRPQPPNRPARRRPLRWVVLAMALLTLLGALGTLGTWGTARAADPAAAPTTRDTEMTLRGGWYPWEPYQYLKKEGERRELTGLDVQLLREAIEGELGLELELSQVSWSQHQLELQTGQRDVAGGAFRTASRKRYAYISKKPENSRTLEQGPFPGLPLILTAGGRPHPNPTEHHKEVLEK